jgi:hypothetical protein
MKDKKWWVNDINKWDKINKDTAQLMLKQSEKLLDETIETAKTISAKSTQLMTILIPLSTILVGYLMQNLAKNGLNYLSITSILGLVCIVISALYCYKNFTPYEIALSGEYPHDIVASKYIDNSFTEKQQYLNMVLNVCDNIENRILANDKFNTSRMRNNDIAIKALFIIPFCPVSAYLLLLLFDVLHCGL